MRKVECPACGGQGWLVPGAKAGHWSGLLRWPARLAAETCEVCNGTGEVEATAERAEEGEGARAASPAATNTNFGGHDDSVS